MRLIDADALGITNRPIGKIMMFGGEYVYTQTEIDSAPTVDAVPVVRCKDCRHGHTAEDKYGEYLYCDISGEDNYDPDFYCANGERKG